ncbi:MAG: UbiA family prenyltransferase [Betaproteobacteria bacterium]|nr:UbiA family prenyltransferase [Betaproteobacteria bacterium]
MTTALSAREIWVRLLVYPTHSLPTAAAPVMVGIALALRDNLFVSLPVFIAFLGSWIIHVGGLFKDNYELTYTHRYLPEHPELLHALETGTLTYTEMRYAIFACFAIPIMMGYYMVAIGGTTALAIGIIGVTSSYCYTGGPRPYTQYGLADPIFVFMFGIVAQVGTYYIQWAALHPAASHGLDALLQLPPELYYVGLPVGALVTNVMVIDDIRDRNWDKVKGWSTFSTRYGLRGGRTEYVTLTVVTYLAPLVYWWWLGFSAWILLPLLSLPLAIHVVRAVLTREQTRELIMMTPRASYLSLIYAALLSLGILLSPN